MSLSSRISEFYGGPLEAYDELGCQFIEYRKEYVLAKCPFHDDSKPSMAIYRNSARFTCFACGASGDIVVFAAMKWGLDPRLEFKHVQQRFLDMGVSGGN